MNRQAYLRDLYRETVFIVPEGMRFTVTSPRQYEYCMWQFWRMVK